MPKVADVERLKLRAAYFNNLSVGLLLAGLLVPYLVVVQHAGDIVSSVTDGTFFSFKTIANAFGVLFAMALALHGSRRMQRHVRETVALLAEENSVEVPPALDTSSNNHQIYLRE